MSFAQRSEGETHQKCRQELDEAVGPCYLCGRTAVGRRQLFSLPVMHRAQERYLDWPKQSIGLAREKRLPLSARDVLPPSTRHRLRTRAVRQDIRR
jgi:hypothetical protein